MRNVTTMTLNSNKHFQEIFSNPSKRLNNVKYIFENCVLIIKLYSFVSAFIIDLCWEEKWIFSMDMFCWTFFTFLHTLAAISMTNWLRSTHFSPKVFYAHEHTKWGFKTQCNLFQLAKVSVWEERDNGFLVAKWQSHKLRIENFQT